MAKNIPDLEERKSYGCSESPPELNINSKESKLGKLTYSSGQESDNFCVIANDELF